MPPTAVISTPQTNSQTHDPANTPAPKPTIDEIMDRLDELGYPAEQTGILIGVLANLATKANIKKAKRGKEAVINMEMAAHDLLDEVMPDRASPRPDSLHKMLNEHFLPTGYTFLHDRRAFCTVEIIRRG
ncbi:MAG TPA: hypothetical protein VLF21_02315 [Candidatus Saccharimonadales bacterium]|nr:hypothetical protein [Candidatus Saccharimonadales bacterium]